MSKPVSILTLSVVMLIALVLVGCSGEASPTATPEPAAPSPTSAAAPAPTATLAPAPAATPTVAAAPTSAPSAPQPTATTVLAPTAVPTAASAALSLDEYLTRLDCETFGGEEEPETYGDLLASFSTVADRMSALNPPDEIAEWHDASLATFEKVKTSLEPFPKDGEIDLIAIIALSESLEEDNAKAMEIASRMPADVRQRMADAGCIDEDAVGAGDDHGDDTQNATSIAVGETVSGSLGSGSDKDVFVFDAVAGMNYEARLPDRFFISFGSKTEPLITIQDSAGREVARSEDDSETEVTWRAEITGSYYVVLGDGASSGDYTLIVQLAAPGQAATDREALVALYNATDGPNWSDNTNWLSDAPMEEWFGVNTDGEGRVIQLFLRDNQLSGEIPPELGSLGGLRSLLLSGNQLSGEIPSELGSLPNLVSLSLGDNRLSGEIPPELGSLSNLEELYLRRNQLGGEIPMELGNLSNLLRLGLIGNQFTGCIPQAFQGGPSQDLGDLGLPFCGVAKESPDRPALVALYNATDGPNWEKNDNWLSDAPIFQWHGITTNANNRVSVLWLDYNQLRGKIPSELGSLSGLEVLVLSRNELSGEIPPELGNLDNLETLGLDENQLSGETPAALGSLPNLRELYLRDNLLSGCIPSELQYLPHNDLGQLGLPFCDE